MKRILSLVLGAVATIATGVVSTAPVLAPTRQLIPRDALTPAPARDGIQPNSGLRDAFQFWLIALKPGTQMR